MSNQKKLILLSSMIIITLLTIIISTSIVSAQTCEVSYIKNTLRKALFDYLPSPELSKLNANEIKDILDFYLNSSNLTTTDCNIKATLSNIDYNIIIDRFSNFTVNFTIPFCEDGTPYGQCSVTKPKYCFAGQLVNRCRLCGGCLSGQECQIDETPEYVIHEGSWGKCVSPLVIDEKCFDSDGGKDFYTKGYVNSSINGTFWDYCDPNDLNDAVVETSCSSSLGIVVFNWVNCPNGCSNGACINQTTLNQTCSDGTFNYQCSSTKPSICVNGTLIDSCSFCGCPSDNVCLADGSCVSSQWNLCSECGTGLFNLCDKGECNSILENCYFIDNLIVNSCSACAVNTTCESYSTDQTTCSENSCGLQNCLWTGSSCITCIDNDKDGYNTTAECGGIENIDCNDSNPNINPKAIEICGNGIDEDCDGVDLACSCTDGTLNYQCSLTNPLFCINETLVNNCQSCGCSSSQFCQVDGSCELRTCTDSDGGINYVERGYVNSSINGTVFDSCGLNDRLTEYYCTQYNYTANNFYTCPNGCSNGACLEEITNLSDGSNEKDLTFNGAGNQTVYIKIGKESNVTFSRLFLNGSSYMNKFTRNPSLDIGGNGVKEWSYPSRFQTVELVSNFSREINEYLITCSQNAEGNCLVPLVFHSDSSGIIKISNISIIHNMNPMNPKNSESSIIKKILNFIKGLFN